MVEISIHALREEGDGIIALGSAYLAISIHALREEGDAMNEAEQYMDKISIHALREEGDEGNNKLLPGLHNISIHALREEGDTTFMPRLAPERYFYPRPPRGGRPFKLLISD